MVIVIARRSNSERFLSAILNFSLSIALAALFLFAGRANAALLYSDNGLEVRWDNTLRYTAGIRLAQANATLLADENGDDGDRNFSRGLMMDRLDLLSTFDVTKSGFGIQASVEAWYDTVYGGHTAKGRDFPTDARHLEGRYADLADTFVYGHFLFDSAAVTVRAGRQTLLWGESIFFDENSIAAAQAPRDYVKSIISPNSYSDNAYLPVDQLSVLIQATPELSFAAYYQFGWRPSRLPPVGSYFSTSDLLGDGADELHLYRGGYLQRGPDGRPKKGRFGLSARMRFDDFDLGIYALQYASSYPLLRLAPDRMRSDWNNLGQFAAEYPDGIGLFGADFSTYYADYTLAGEITYRDDAPVVGYPLTSAYQYVVFQGRNFYAYGKANTLHAEVSAATTFAPSLAWDSADIAFELGANSILTIKQNRSDLDLSEDRAAVNIRASFEPRYFEVVPGLDISLPIGASYEPVGRYGPSYSENAHTGDLEAGISAIYASEWKMRLSYNYFYGEPVRQPMVDRNFVAFSVERTF